MFHMLSSLNALRELDKVEFETDNGRIEIFTNIGRVIVE